MFKCSRSDPFPVILPVGATPLNTSITYHPTGPLPIPTHLTQCPTMCPSNILIQSMLLIMEVRSSARTTRLSRHTCMQTHASIGQVGQACALPVIPDPYTVLMPCWTLLRHQSVGGLAGEPSVSPCSVHTLCVLASLKP